MLPFYTIGHSNRSIDAFIGLLSGAEINLVADIRKMPMSRANPQFNDTALAKSLAPIAIGYEHIAALGGLRGKTHSEPQDVNGLWKNKSFHNYADYALTAPFRAGLDELRNHGRQQRCAIMCSEAVWWRCHRRIVSDYLIASGETVFHIMGKGRLAPARLTPGAIVQPDGTVIYPAIRAPAG